MAFQPLVSVVIPTRNEGDNVALLVERLESALAAKSFEAIFVDDSDDDTTDRIRALAEARPPDHIRLMARSGSERHGGLSTAVVSGMRLARGRYVCVMDADLQHPPETVPLLLEAAQDGADLVVASRYARGGSRAGLSGGTRRVVSVGATALARILFAEARRSTDPLAGFFLCGRTLVDGIEFRPVGFKILLELLVCVPQGTVRDVPLAFAPRQSGASKASTRQAALYVRHLWSLFFSVQGSARLWKFALVGVSGLLVFLPLLAALHYEAHLPPLVAFGPAWAASVAWNTVLNRILTFADQRRRSSGEGPRRYLTRALGSGAAMFAAFAGLIAAGVGVLGAGIVAALVAMSLNALLNRRTVSVRPSVWGRVAVDEGVQASLARLATQVGASRAYLLPGSGSVSETSGVPAEIVQRVVRSARPAVWTEAPSRRPQRRTNIDHTSTLLVPVVNGSEMLAVLVCEKVASHGFDDGALDAAMRAVEGLTPAIAALAD